MHSLHSLKGTKCQKHVTIKENLFSADLVLLLTSIPSIILFHLLLLVNLLLTQLQSEETPVGPQYWGKERVRL